MADETVAPTDEADKPTPETEAPDTGQADETGNENEADLESFDLSQVPENADREWFESQVKNLRSDYTRKTQSLAEQRKQVQQAQTIVEAVRDPQHPNHAEAMEYLGLEEADVEDDGEDDFDEPSSQLEKRLAALEAERQKEQQTAAERQQQEALETALVERIDEAQNTEGREFDEDELRYIVNYTTGEDGLPDIAAGVKGLKAFYAKRRKEWADPKKNPPRGPGGGVPATRELDITDSATRQDMAAQVAAAAMRG